MFLRPLLVGQSGSFALRGGPERAVLARKIETAFDRSTRNKGLLGRTGLAADEALILAPCFAVHTFGMQFPIDVVFAARDGRILKIRSHLGAQRIAWAFGAFATIELTAGAVTSTGLEAGHYLEIVSVDDIVNRGPSSIG